MRGFDMITLIMGGSGSGKSAYAEDYALAQAGESSKYYIATMQIYDAEWQRKEERNRTLRAGKGFVMEHIAPLEMDAVDSKFRPHHN